MIDKVSTEFVAVWDVDIIIDETQIINSIMLLRNGIDVVYPYSVFLDTSCEIRRMYLEQEGNIDLLYNLSKYMNELYGPNPVGGAFFLRTECYIQSGKENENYYGWGYEDGDRYYRWQNQKFKVQRVEGPLFHLSHPRGINSSVTDSNETLIKKRELFNTIKNNNE